MLKMGMGLRLQRSVLRIWITTKNFITSTGAVFHTSAGEIFNVK